MMEQQQGRVVGPLQVVEQQHRRADPAHSFQELRDVLEQVVALLFGWQLERRWDVSEHPAEVGDQPRHLRRRVTERLAQHLRWRHPRVLLDDLDERDERRRALHLVAASGQGEAALLPGRVEHLLDQPRLPDTRLAADQH